MRIFFWGTYTIAEGYPVNRVLIKGLRQAGAQVEECREELWEGFLHQAFGRKKPGTYLKLGWRALRLYLRLLRRFSCSRKCQYIIVGYAGYLDIVLARLLNFWRRRPLILVAFISLYDTIVVDRQQLAAASWQAACLKKIDRLAFSCADIVLVDTREQIDYLAALFALPREKFRRSFVGEDDELFHPAVSDRGHSGVLRVLFFGTYVPLHGIESILDAAEILRPDTGVEFTLIGNGQLYPQMRSVAAQKGLNHVRFIDEWMSSAALVEQIRAADVCLGIFGVTTKAARVIPYKVFDALALRKPVITRDSPAARELLEHGKSALLCAPGNGAELAGSIRSLQQDPQLLEKLAARGYARFQEFGSPRAIGRALLHTMEGRFGA